MSRITVEDNYPSITWVVLAGGRGRRMLGQDKGLIKVESSTLIEVIITELKAQIRCAGRNDPILISANRNISSYQNHSDVVEDCDSKFLGPLSGMYAALQKSNTDWIAVMPCDSPNVPLTYVKRMVEAAQNSQGEALIASDGSRLQPVFCMIRRSLLPKIEAFLNRNERKVGYFFRQIGAEQIDFSDTPELFVNINNPEDLASYISSISSE